MDWVVLPRGEGDEAAAPSARGCGGRVCRARASAAATVSVVGLLIDARIAAQRPPHRAGTLAALAGSGASAGYALGPAGATRRNRLALANLAVAAAVWARGSVADACSPGAVLPRSAGGAATAAVSAVGLLVDAYATAHRLPQWTDTVAALAGPADCAGAAQDPCGAAGRVRLAGVRIAHVGVAAAASARGSIADARTSGTMLSPSARDAAAATVGHAGVQVCLAPIVSQRRCRLRAVAPARGAGDGIAEPTVATCHLHIRVLAGPPARAAVVHVRGQVSARTSAHRTSATPAHAATASNPAPTASASHPAPAAGSPPGR